MAPRLMSRGKVPKATGKMRIAKRKGVNTMTMVEQMLANVTVDHQSDEGIIYLMNGNGAIVASLYYDALGHEQEFIDQVNLAREIAGRINGGKSNDEA